MNNKLSQMLNHYKHVLCAGAVSKDGISLINLLKLNMMKKVIWKFELDHKGNQEIELPIDYEILTIQVQNETPCLWVLVDPNKPKEKEIFEIYGTGHEIHYDMGIDRKYVGTFQENKGMYVWHLFRYTGV